MKILIDAHVFDGTFHGSRTYLKGIYQEMIHLKKDWQFFLASNNISKLESEFGSSKNIHYVKLESKNKYIRLLIELPFLIYRHKIDYSHFQYITPLIKVGKYIVTTHDILFEEKRFQPFFTNKYRKVNGFLFKISAKRADVLVTVSDYSKEKINEIYNIKKENIHITPNAISEDIQGEIKSDYIKKQYGCDKYMLYVSRIEPRKNHISILKAYIKLKLYLQEYQIVFVGFQDMAHKELKEFMKKNKEHFNNRLHLFSNIPHDELRHFYCNAEFVVYPSFAEGFGIPPLEAAMYNKPVICSSATAMKEFSFFKYHVNPNIQQEIETAIESIIIEKENGQEDLKQIIRQKYNWRNSAKVLIDLIR